MPHKSQIGSFITAPTQYTIVIQEQKKRIVTILVNSQVKCKQLYEHYKTSSIWQFPHQVIKEGKGSNFIYWIISILCHISVL